MTEIDKAREAWTTFVASFESHAEPGSASAREIADALVHRLKTANGFVPSAIRSIEGTDLPPGFVWRKRDGEWLVDDVRERSARLLDRLASRGIAPGKKLTSALARQAADLLLESEGFVLDRWERFVHPDHPGTVIRVKERNLREEKEGRAVSSVSVIDWVARRLQVLSNRALREAEGRRAKSARQEKVAGKKKAAARKASKAEKHAAQERLGRRFMKRLVDEGLAERLTLAGSGFEGDPDAFERAQVVMKEIEVLLDAEIAEPTSELEMASWFSTAHPPWPFRFRDAPAYRWDEDERTVSLERISNTERDAEAVEVRIGGTQGFLVPKLGNPDAVGAPRPIDLDRKGEGYLIARVLPPGLERAKREGLRLVPGSHRPALAIVTFMDRADPVSASLLVRLLRAWRVEGVFVTDRRVAHVLLHAGAAIAAPADAKKIQAALAARVVGVEPWVPHASVVLLLPD